MVITLLVTIFFAPYISIYINLFADLQSSKMINVQNFCGIPKSKSILTLNSQSLPGHHHMKNDAMRLLKIFPGFLLLLSFAGFSQNGHSKLEISHRTGN